MPARLRGLMNLRLRAVTARRVDDGCPPLRSPIRWAAATRGRRVGATTTTTRKDHGGSLSPRRGDHGVQFSLYGSEALHPLSRPKDFWVWGFVLSGPRLKSVCSSSLER